MRIHTQSRTAWGSALVAVAMIASGFAMAGGKPNNGGGKGGGKGGDVPPGRIHFTQWDDDQGFLGYFSMLADGSDILSEPQVEPSYQLHDGHRWYLTWRADGGNLPRRPGCTTSDARYQLAAVRDDGIEVPLTNETNITVEASLRWGKDDTFVSFVGTAWTAVASGQGNLTDADGNEWLLETWVYRIEIEWQELSVLEPVPISPILEVTQGGVELAGDCFVYSDIRGHDWSPIGDRLVVWRRPGYYTTTTGQWSDDLWIADFLGGSPQFLVHGLEPEWAPDTSDRVIFAYDESADQTIDVIWAIEPNGTGLTQLTNGGGVGDSDPHWSPDGAHFTFTRIFHNRQRGKQDWGTVTTSDVLRAGSDGSGVENLTKKLDTHVQTVAWR